MLYDSVDFIGEELKRVHEINVKVEKQLKKSTPQFLFQTK